MSGRLIQIAEPIANEDGGDESARFRFTEDLARQFGSAERLAKSRVVIVSVAGAFRKGKSFLLNFFLRYLRALERGNTNEWIHSRDTVSDGFPWRSGSERDTAGIHIWSEPFFIRKPNGEEMAVLLMDTQGTFDHQSTQQDCTTIFAFSTLLSSVQIFNISQNIQETDLQHLRLFVEFASMVKKTKEPVLQNLWFLVRDWQNPDEFSYGVNGGKPYLDTVLACDSRKPKENQELRQGIRQHFQKSSCCLLPYPGQIVARKQFQGEVDKLDPEFVTELESFVSHILSPENLVVKKINGKDLTGAELFGFVKVYSDAFRLGKLPSPKSIFLATVEMANMAAAKDSMAFFDKGMQDLANSAKAISDQELKDLLNVMLDQSLQHFDANCMDSGSRETVQAREKLEDQLQGQFQQQILLNRLKSDKISVEKKNDMLVGDIKRMQKESQDSVRRMKQLEEEFANKLQEIQGQSVSKEEMEALLQEQYVKHSLAQEEANQQSEELASRINQMAEMNQTLMEELKDNREEAQRNARDMMERHQREMQSLQGEIRNSQSRGDSGGCSVL